MDLLAQLKLALDLTVERYSDKRWDTWARRFVLGVDRSSKTTEHVFKTTVFQDTPIEWSYAFWAVRCWQKSVNPVVTEAERKSAAESCQKTLNEIFVAENVPETHFKL